MGRACPGSGCGSREGRQHRAPELQRVEHARCSERIAASMRLRGPASSSSASASSWPPAARAASDGLRDAGQARSSVGGGFRRRGAAGRDRIPVTAPGPGRRRRSGRGSGAERRAGRPRTAAATAAIAGSSGRLDKRDAQPGPGSARAACSSASSGVSSCASPAIRSQPAAQAARARTRALRAQQPAAQFGAFRPAELGAERAVGGVEHVVALVEHVARRDRCRRSRPCQAACAMTSAWLATTRSAVRARRTVCSTKQRL